MAIYEYKCTNEKCQEIFESTVSMSSDEQERLEQKCPKCNSIGKRTWGIGAIYVEGIKGMTRKRIGKNEKGRKTAGQV